MVSHEPHNTAKHKERSARHNFGNEIEIEIAKLRSTKKLHTNGSFYIWHALISADL